VDVTEDAKLQVPSTQSVGERVLIVEDDPSTREGLAELVQTWGFQTEEAADGEEGLRKVTSFRPAIIVSDMVMPRVGGMELLRALKDQLSDLTLILLTAQGTVETAVEAIKEGAYDYLSKPVDPQRLQILLKKAVERNDTAEIRSASEALTSVWNEVSSKLYAEASKGQGGEAPPQGEPQQPPHDKGEGGDGAVDADYEVVK